jgi:hypothetical protein
MTVNTHAAPTPTSRMHSSQDWTVGNGSLACQRSNAKAAATETANCMKRIREV